MPNTARSLRNRPFDGGPPPSARGQPEQFHGRRGWKDALVAPRYPSLIDPPIGFAHRGARAHAPENTLDAFALALKLGATGLETDVWLTADRVPVLDHDGLIRRRMLQRPISAVARSALPRHIPELRELIDLCGPSTHVSIDVKDAAAGPIIIDTVQVQRPDLLGRLWLCAPDVASLAALRRLDPQVRLVNSTRLARIKEGPERRAATLREQRIDAINLHYSDWTGGLTALFHRFERFCLAWDLQYEHLLRQTLELGIDGVYSDWVDRMSDALTAYAGG
jgi:glycerophosphoryl diester phosphodiesterase